MMSQFTSFSSLYKVRARNSQYKNEECWRMTKFKVGDKVRILDVDSIMYGSDYWQNGDITEVLEINRRGNPRVAMTRGDDVGQPFVITQSEFRFIELVSDNPTKNQRITTLESEVSGLTTEVAELKAKVEALEKAKKPSLDYEGSAQFINGERVIKVAPTYNEQRKAIIAEAKAFIEAKTHYLQDSSKVKGGWSAKKRENPNFCDYITKPEFIVNAEKRTVVALIRNMNGSKIRAKAIAKCAPDDVFNADIGKAIALGRALGLDVSRFEQAVKPTEVVVGMVVKGGSDGAIYNVVPEFSMDGGVLSVEFCRDIRRYSTILNDTEAQY